MNKTLLELAQELEFETEWEYFEYIVDSYINDQIQQVKSLYNNMHPNDGVEFKDYLITETDLYNEITEVLT